MRDSSSSFDREFDASKEKVSSQNPMPKKRYALPSWQLRFCANYEFARESPLFVCRVREDRSDERIKRSAPPRLWRLREALTFDVPEFPEKSWQSISAVRRGKILELCGIDPTTGDPPALAYVGEPQRFIGEILANDKDFPPIDQPLSILDINFRESDDAIIKAFACWLQCRRVAFASSIWGDEYNGTAINTHFTIGTLHFEQVLRGLDEYRANKPIARDISPAVDVRVPELLRRCLWRFETEGLHYFPGLIL